MFRDIPESQAQDTLNAAWNNGIRYFDTAPFYGAGLAEIRLGEMLSQHSRDSYVVSTKVGRIIEEGAEDPSERELGEKGGLFAHGRPNRMIDDYTAEATRRSVEDSIDRMGIDHLDMVWVHDIAQDFHGDEWIARFETARTGAFRALAQMRDEGTIRAWGLGVNKVEPIELTLSLTEPKPDGFLLAGRYTLLDHSLALQRLLPMAAEHGVEMVVGGPYSSGVLAGGTHFEYQPAPKHIIEAVSTIRELAKSHGISMKAAALQFSLAHPVTAAIVPGATRPGRILEDVEAMSETVPMTFWRDLRAVGLLDPSAPLPGDN